MPLDFPNSPTTGDLFNGAGVTWRWDGVKWTSVLSSGGPYLPLSGGTMSGPLNYTATGGNTSRSAQDRAADVIHVQDYGAIGTGDANIDTATVLTAVAALPENGGVLRIGTRNVQGVSLNQTITITKSCKIEGVTTNGWCSSVVCQMSGPAFLFSDPTPTYQKTFEVSDIRFVANNPTGPTAAAIRVSVGPTGSQAFPSFVGRNITISANVASAAAPFARTFTKGIDFLPSSISGTGGVHNFWNVVLENVHFLGVPDSGTGQPITGTAGVSFGRLIYGAFRNVHVSTAASGFRQTDYCEGITCVSCQILTVTNGWDMASFAPTGAAAVKLLQPVMLGCMINAAQSSLALDCVNIGQFAHCYLTGAGAVNVAFTNAQATYISQNSILNGTIGISMTRAGFNEGGNTISENTFANQTTHISLGASTFDAVLDNMQGNSAPVVIANSGGTGNMIRGPNGPLTIGNNVPLSINDASGSPMQFICGSDNHFGFYSTDASGASLPVWGIYNAHSATPIQYFQIPTSFTTSVGFNNTAPIAKPTGVAVTAAAIHAALVSYGLIAP